MDIYKCIGLVKKKVGSPRRVVGVQKGISTFESNVAIRYRCLRLNMNISDSLRGVDRLAIEVHRVATLVSVDG